LTVILIAGAPATPRGLPLAIRSAMVRSYFVPALGRVEAAEADFLAVDGDEGAVAIAAVGRLFRSWATGL
jgi:hypothetical protein